VVVADDSVLLREGLKRILEEGGFEVVGQSGTAGDLMLKVRSYEPDLAIVDIRMPPTQSDEGLRAAQEIRERHRGNALHLLSQYVESGYALELLADSAEGVGYLLKDRVSDVNDFTAAAKRVASGGTALDPEVVSRLVGRRKGNRPARRALAARARGAGADGRGSLQLRHRRAPGDHRTRGREAHHEHLRKAQPARRPRRPPTRPRSPSLPPELAPNDWCSA
jgi:DNA-binding NarL/FixJ family response regulator